MPDDGHPFIDVAIPISWPDKTARGDEKWMALLKKMGIVKNLNFRVGHAAILLIERKTGRIEYFDFGRYIVPRGYGRSRSARFDPRLKIKTIARFCAHSGITNLDEILAELDGNTEATHGGGRTLFCCCEKISFAKGMEYAERLVQQGPILYGAFAKNNNSCSRYVAQILSEAMPLADPRRGRILYPESLKASPTSNVVNAAADRQVFCHEHGETLCLSMGRRASVRFQFDLLRDNFSKKGAARLGKDSIAGMVQYNGRPANVPTGAQWMGGIGEGAWFTLTPLDNHHYVISKHNAQGTLEYEVGAPCPQGFDSTRAYAFTYYFSYECHQLIQDGQLFSFLSAMSEADNIQTQQDRQAII